MGAYKDIYTDMHIYMYIYIAQNEYHIYLKRKIFTKNKNKGIHLISEKIQKWKVLAMKFKSSESSDAVL